MPFIGELRLGGVLGGSPEDEVVEKGYLNACGVAASRATRKRGVNAAESG
jgi:hypothetical protein